MPTLVTELQGKQVVHVAAGNDLTICTTANGSVFTWDGGDAGQLGLGDDRSKRLVPTLALVGGELQNRTVMQIASGLAHPACTTKDGSVFTWGDNEHGQLGVSVVGLASLQMVVQALDINVVV